MSQEDNTETFKETFNVSLKDNLVAQPKKSSKMKYFIGIISSVIVLAVTATLLLGYFKFNWFKSEIYQLDANIVRQVNQANYFTETKKVNTKVALNDEGYQEEDFEVNTNFMVFLNERKPLKKDDYLNTATFILLKSKLISKEGEQDLPSFDLTNEEKIKEFEANPDGSKFPMALFSFFENGTIDQIRLPDTMDKYHAETIKELIEKVIPKLSRNKTEDNDNGLNIKTRTDRKKKTFIEEEKPKQYYSFRGSKYARSTERDFEEGKLTNIRSNSNIHLQSTPEEGEGEEEEKQFGPKDFYFNSKSDIVSTVVKEGQKEEASLLGKMIKKFNLITAEKLFEKFAEEEKEEEVPEEPRPEMRNLGYSISADQTFNIGKYNVLGQTVTVKYRVGVSGGKPFNEIIIGSKLGTTTIGNTGVSLKGSWSKTIVIFKFAFPAFPAISINAKAKGTISWSVSVTSGSGSSVKLSASLGGKITLGAEIKAGWDILLSYSAGVEGVIVNASGSASIANKKVTKNFTISAGKIYLYLDKSVLNKKKRVAEKTLYNGW